MCGAPPRILRKGKEGATSPGTGEVRVGEWLWAPPAERVARSRMAAFMTAVRDGGVQDALTPGASDVRDYASLREWSVERPREFWPAVWQFCDIVADTAPGERLFAGVLLGGDRMAPPDPDLGPRWFPSARLNFAENLLRFRDHRPAILFWNERGRQGSLTHAALYSAVARVAAALRAMGVRTGDRVAGFMPNVPETVIAMLATTSIGAIWSSCSPDFGVKGVLDRFGQIEPRVLFCADGYRYAGKDIDCLDRIREIAAAIPSLERIVLLPSLRSESFAAGIRDAILWDDFLGSATPRAEIEFTRLPFDHPLYIMYSSGTTGMPKCMVHGAGGTLLQHLKELVLHTDLRRDDVFFYYTTCGWMMWNWLVSGLAVGATIVLYDGSVLSPNANALWDMAASEGVTVFGTSAKYLALIAKKGIEPARTHDLGALRTILSTGSPLEPWSYEYVYGRVKADVHLASISGGTDIISCFALGSPIDPVYAGELQRRGLGMAVDVYDDSARPVRGAPGELVCTAPFPSMPVAFWNDPAGEKYRAAYFEHFPGVWRHGDWVELTAHDGMIVHGRSDATLNPGGVRIGTAEIYRQVEQMPEVLESLAIDQVRPIRNGVGDSRIVLFVRLHDGLLLTDALRERLQRRIRDNLSPHHVPKRVVQVADLPRTISGKISEIAVRDVVHGRPVRNTDALANPEALDLFRDLEVLRK